MKEYIPCKIVIAGDGGTGKSTLLTARTTGKFNCGSNITIGVDFACLTIPFEGMEYPFLIYDLGGQKRFHFLHDSYIQGTKAGILLYDVTRKSSFDNIQTWISLLRKENPLMPMILVGSKIDLVQPEDILFFKKEWEKIKLSIEFPHMFLEHIFISSKDFNGIDELFSFLAYKILPVFIEENQKTKICIC